MKLQIVVHPSSIILEYLLEHLSKVLESNSEEYLKVLILDKKDLTKSDSDILSNIFSTSSDYWLNLQKQWDLLKEEPLKDMSISCDTCIKALISISNTKQPAYFPTVSGEPIYMLTEQSYKYLLSKCTEEEAWDLGWLGQSEEHISSKKMDNKLLKSLNKFKKE